MSLKQTLEAPESVRHAASVIAALDRCLLLGFGRLGPEQHAALDGLVRVTAGSPLAAAVTDAVAALKRNEFLERHFTALAAARAALQGAQHDALRAVALAALGRPATSDGPGAIAELPDALKSRLEAVRHWLMEVVLAGFRNIEHTTLAPFHGTLEQVQAEPALTRLSALLTGFLHELSAALPIAAPESVPVHRWADLWTRGMVGSLRVPATPAGTKTNGRLFPLGADVRHHGFFASAGIYGLLDAESATRVVRVTLSSYKVDVLAGREMWRCFADSAGPLLQGLSEGRSAEIKGATLLPGGDLLWDGKATVGKPFGRWEMAARLAPGAGGVIPLSPVAAVDRHPVQIAELVYLEGPDGKLPIATTRLSPACGLGAKDVENPADVLGLLRFDGGSWTLQPLAVRTSGGRSAVAGQDAYEAATVVDRKKGDTLAILRERASRLLRKRA